MRKSKRGKRIRDIHPYDMAGAVVQGTVTCHGALDAFPFIPQYPPIPFSTAGIYLKIPIFLSQFLPYLFQCLHCSIQTNPERISIETIFLHKKKEKL